VIDDRALVARVLLVIWVAGTSTFTLSILFAPPPDGTAVLLWSVSGVGYAMSLALWVRRSRLPGWTPDASGYLCYALATIVTAASHDATTPFGLFYLWVVVVSCHFLPLRRAAPQIAVVPPAFALALVLTGDPPFPWVRWALLSLTVAAVGASVSAMRTRISALVDVLADSARTDALTGLRNRRAFEETLDVELERAARTGQPVALVIADLDHFKAVNDQYGHPVGDSVLRQAGQTIGEHVRRGDVAFRIGGEEFAVVAPGADAATAHLLAERLRRAVGDALQKMPGAVTVSLGVAAYPEHGPDAVAVMANADAACYQAKERGRDRTVSAAPGRWTPAPRTATPERQVRLAP
jgi:diguanylate cyclase (GGDEF)-like protein